MNCETLSLVLIVVGTMALILMMFGSSYNGESYHRHSATCGCPGMCDGFARTKQTAARPNSRKMFDQSNTTKPGPYNDGFANKECPYSDDGDIPVSLAHMDYGRAIKHMALESDVQKSHSEWLGEFAHRTTTASSETVRDDPNNIVTPMGLAAMMRQGTQYTTRAQPLAESRTIPSDIPCDMGGARPSLSFYGRDE